MSSRILERLNAVGPGSAGRGRTLSGIAALCVLVLVATAAGAQQGEIAGTITALGTGEPLAGAQVVVVGGAQRALSDERGRFRITGVPAGNVTLEVRRIGYRLERVQTSAGQTSLGVVLSVNPASLEAVVVTGTVGATE